MATFPRSRQATHHVTILCKLQGLNFLLMLMILATDGNNDLIPTEVLCQSGWKQGDNFCFKVFDGKTEKQSYDAANQFCKDRNVELLSEDDVDTYHYTEKTFWVYGKKRGSCQYYKSSTKELIVIETDCKQNGTAVCKGPSQCPIEVNVTEQTNSSITLFWLPGHNGGAPQHFIVFYNQNSSADDRKWRRRTVLLPSNSSNASCTIDNLPADTVFLFRVVGVYMFEDTVNSSACEEHTVTARTFANKKDADSLEIFGLKVSMLHITIGASVLAVIILLIVVAIIFICRKQAAKKRKNRDVPEDVTRHPTGDVQEYANAQVIRDAWSGSERESWDQGDDSEMIKEVKLSSNNAVYESLCADETEESHTYAN